MSATEIMLFGWAIACARRLLLTVDSAERVLDGAYEYQVEQAQSAGYAGQVRVAEFIEWTALYIPRQQACVDGVHNQHVQERVRPKWRTRSARSAHSGLDRSMLTA